MCGKELMYYPCSPKENLVDLCCQLRPISLTDVIMRLFEKFVYQSEIADIVYDYVGDDHAYKKGITLLWLQ